MTVHLPGPSLDRLMPMHLCVDAGGRIRTIGPTLARLFPQIAPGQAFLTAFALRRPRAAASFARLRAHAPAPIRVEQVGGQQAQLRGLPVDDGAGGLVINLSFGIGVIDAVRRHDLDQGDFAATDLAVEMLYLNEAKSSAMRESLRLNSALDDARMLAQTQAMQDALTGLLNRRGLDAALARLLEGELQFALAHFDLDFFKQINDTLGHAAGDHILTHVARVFERMTREGDIIARVGGDEFVLLMPGVTDPGAIRSLNERIIAALERPVDYNGTDCTISASAGVALTTAYATPRAERLLDDADTALYASKNAGRGRVSIAGV